MLADSEKAHLGKDTLSLFFPLQSYTLIQRFWIGTWTFVSIFTLFSYVNPFDIKEYFKCWNNCRIKLVAQTTTRFITGKSFIKVLLFDKNVALAQENTSVSVYYYTFPFPFSQLEF